MTLVKDEFTRGAGGLWSPPWVDHRFAVAGYCGWSFDQGLLRFHDSESGPEAVDWVGNAFGGIVGQVSLFAFDWVGRQYAVMDPTRSRGPEPDVVTFDLGIGEVRLVTTLDDFVRFTEDGTITEILEADAFEAWRQIDDGGPLLFDQCAGFVHPPFLGGEESVDNLERSDISVYWHIVGSLFAQTKDLPEGTVISEVTGSDG